MLTTLLPNKGVGVVIKGVLNMLNMELKRLFILGERERCGERKRGEGLSPRRKCPSLIQVQLLRHSYLISLLCNPDFLSLLLTHQTKDGVRGGRCPISPVGVLLWALKTTLFDFPRCTRFHNYKILCISYNKGVCWFGHPAPSPFNKALKTPSCPSTSRAIGQVSEGKIVLRKRYVYF